MLVTKDTRNSKERRFVKIVDGRRTDRMLSIAPATLSPKAREIETRRCACSSRGDFSTIQVTTEYIVCTINRHNGSGYRGQRDGHAASAQIAKVGIVGFAISKAAKEHLGFLPTQDCSCFLACRSFRHCSSIESSASVFSCSCPLQW